MQLGERPFPYLGPRLDVRRTAVRSSALGRPRIRILLLAVDRSQGEGHSQHGHQGPPRASVGKPSKNSDKLRRYEVKDVQVVDVTSRVLTAQTHIMVVRDVLAILTRFRVVEKTLWYGGPATRVVADC